MNDLPPLEANDFAAFFEAVHQYPPFPWQQRLARDVVSTGRWPEVLDLPTGTGKTAAIDVAVFALALAAGRPQRAAPLRIIYVVDRRTIVDQAYSRAETIRATLRASDVDVVKRVRQRLESYSGGGVPLRTAQLRGGIARDDLWARTPDQPLVAVSTVDQVGSRLLFRGYGVSDSMKSVHAGLLGVDALYLLDEVHLSQPFRETLRAIGDRYRGWAEKPIHSPFVIVEMSATPGDQASGSFRLDDDDRRNAVLAARLGSSKPVSLVSANAKGFQKEVEKHVTEMLDKPGATVAVVVNRVKSARELHQRIRETLPDGSADVHLLTGRMRPFDRDALEGGVLRRIQAGRKRSEADKPLVIVATQSIEAGADFDFDGVVTECASLDALRQRFGRLDRLGALAGNARGVVVARTDSLKDDPVYGDAIGKTWEWLQTTATEQVVDFGLDALVAPPDAAERGLLAPKAHAPVLLPNHLDAWVQTAPIPEPDPDVSLWLHGPQSGAADVQIVWRADLTEDLVRGAAESGGDTEGARDVVIGLVEALPPASGEAMSVPFLAAKRWLEGQPEPEFADVEGAADEAEPSKGPASQAVRRPAVLWQGDASRVMWGDQLRPGQTIVVPASYGGVRFFNWAPESTEAVSDVAEVAALRQRKQLVVRLNEAVISGLSGSMVGVPKPDGADADTSDARDDRQVVREWIEGLDAAATESRGRDVFDRLRSEVKSVRVSRVPLSASKDPSEYFLVTGGRRVAPSDDAELGDDQVSSESVRSSFVGGEVTLADHLVGVAAMASGFAERVGLPADLVADLRLAGEWHDAGKADPRFQRWLHGGSEFKALVQAEPLAKGAVRLPTRLAMRQARERAAYPAGARHELMSIALMDIAEESVATAALDWALVRHLVASHHGHCRPLAPWVPDPHPTEVVFSRKGIACSGSSAHDFARLDSGIAERFWQMVRTYGWWGVAWLETLLRLADHRQSAIESQAKGAHDA